MRPCCLRENARPTHQVFDATFSITVIFTTPVKGSPGLPGRRVFLRGSSNASSLGYRVLTALHTPFEFHDGGRMGGLAGIGHVPLSECISMVE